jgi:hypothetical protein
MSDVALDEQMGATSRKTRGKRKQLRNRSIRTAPKRRWLAALWSKSRRDSWSEFVGILFDQTTGRDDARNEILD